MENNTVNNPTDKNKNSKALLITIIGVLVALNAGLLYMWQKSGNEKDKVEKSFKASTKENEELKSTLADAEHLLKKYQIDSAAMAEKHKELGSEIITKRNEIAALVAKLRSTQNASASQIAELRAKNNEMAELIAKLQKENTELIAKNKELDDRRAQLEEENKTISTKYEQEATENARNKALAQRLTTQNLKVEAMKKRLLSKKQVSTTRAKDVESFQTSFTIAENAEAPPGERTIYIKITGPDGITLENPGGEEKVFKYEGQESKYTYKIKEIFDQEARPVKATEWKPSADLKAGKYTIELYCDGFKMGGTSLTLK